MPNEFFSPRRTLERAKHHIRDFNVRLIAFSNDQNWTYVRERNIEGTANTHKIVCGTQFFDEAPNVIFDALNNMRSTLDQCAYAAAVASGNTRLKKVAFPFGKESTDLDNAIHGYKVCEDIPPDIVALFRSFKPYKRGNPALWHMNNLCNSQKHAILAPTTVGNLQVRVGGAIVGLQHRWVPEKNHIEIIGADGANLNYADEIAFSVAFANVDSYLRDSEPVAVLRTMCREVQRVLMATEAECRRLGFVA